MMQLNQDYSVAKTLFTAECEKRGIPLYNRPLAVHTILELLQKDPDDDTLRSLLFMVCAGGELFVSKFASYRSGEADEMYEEVMREYGELTTAYLEQENLEDTFSDYLSDERVIAVDSSEWELEWDLIAPEAGTIAELMERCLFPGDEVPVTLIRNLCGVLTAVKEDPFLKRCLPLILFLVMTRLEEQIKSEAHFSFALKDLFAYRAYEASPEKKKTRKRQKAYIKLYRKLCKYYKNEQAVDKKQCRYGFWATSNLGYFSLEEYGGTKKLCPPLLYLLLYADISGLEAEVSAEWEPQNLFDVPEEVWDAYYDCEEDTPYREDHVDKITIKYAEGNSELLLRFMKALYAEKEEVRRIVDEVFRQVIPQDDANERFADAARTETFYMVLQALDEYVEQELYRVCMQ